MSKFNAKFETLSDKQKEILLIAISDNDIFEAIKMLTKTPTHSREVQINKMKSWVGYKLGIDKSKQLRKQHDTTN